MIDSNNIGVMRENIRKLDNLRTNVDANTDAIGEINSLIGATPLPTGKTITNSIIKEVSITATTNESGYCTLVGCPPDKVINAIVLSPIRNYCHLYKGSDGAENISAVVRTRDNNIVASTEITFKAYLINS